MRGQRYAVVQSCGSKGCKLSMTIFRSTIAKLVGYLWTGVLGALCWPVVFFGKRATFAFGLFWAKGVLAISRIFAGVTWKVEGLEHLPEAPYILASKHQSFFDTAIWSLLIPNAAYVMKEELLTQPIFGWFIRHLDIVALDRSAGLSSLRKLLVDSAAKAEAGMPVIIFPEGTRTFPVSEGATTPASLRCTKSWHCRLCLLGRTAVCTGIGASRGLSRARSRLPSSRLLCPAWPSENS